MPISRFVPISLFVQAASVGMVFALLHEVQDENNLSTASIGLISGVGLFSAVFGQVGLAPLAARGKGRELMVGAMIVGSLGAFGFALGEEVWQLVLARAISGAALGAFDPAAQALVTTRDPERAGELLGKLIGVRTAGFLIGPGLGAVVAEFGDNDTPFFVTSPACCSWRWPRPSPASPPPHRWPYPKVARPAASACCAVARRWRRSSSRLPS